MKIGELAARTGLTAHTIRYYERIGLLPRADRDAGKQRNYDPSILVWIAFIGRLKTTGMPIADMLKYTRLRELGPQTGPARSKLLQVHRDRVRAHVAELQSCLTTLDDKITTYSEAHRNLSHDEHKHKSRNPLRTRHSSSG